MHISIIGSGYVGLVSGACLSEFGHAVTCMDVDEEKITQLQQGVMPIYEPGLEEIVRRNQKAKRLIFTTDIQDAVKGATVIFIAVGTPPQEDGSTDMSYVLAATESIADYIDGYKIIVNKSTVPIGTAAKTKEILREKLRSRGLECGFDVVSNPEFLREGAAVTDFMHPDRIVIGCESSSASDIMQEIYRVVYLNNHPFVMVDNETAETIKYAANAFLATKITFINEISQLCDAVGANVKQVSNAMGLDKRIGHNFLNAGPGYGGSCFPKDTRALLQMCKEHGCSSRIVAATIAANEHQKHWMVEKISNEMGDLEDKRIAILGLAFKPETDDVRDAPSATIIPELLKRGTSICAFDPIAMDNAKKFDYGCDCPERLSFCQNEYEAITDADAIVLLTEWNQFRSLDWNRVLESMRGRYFFDLRNVYDREKVECLGLVYHGVGC